MKRKNPAKALHLLAGFILMACVFPTAARGQSAATSMDLFKTGSRFFITGDYPHAAIELQKALDLEKQEAALPHDYWRVLVDNLAMSYGIPGDLKRAREVLEYGISQDPEYPNFHYTLACEHAESGDLDHTLDELRTAFKYKANRIAGEAMPDPRIDESFRKFRDNPRFQTLMESLYPRQVTLYWHSNPGTTQPPATVVENVHEHDGGQDRVRAQPDAHPVQRGKRIYFVTIGEFPAADIDSLVSYYRQAYQLEIEILAGIDISESAFNKTRQQLAAEKLLDAMHRAFPALARDPNAIVIGFTAADIYTVSEDWRFAFGCRDDSGRAAVVSSARMDLHYPEEPVDQARPDVRLRKMVTKDIGILYYNLPQNSNPRSVLYDNILGIEELDAMGENF